MSRDKTTVTLPYIFYLQQKNAHKAFVLISIFDIYYFQLWNWFQQAFDFMRGYR